MTETTTTLFFFCAKEFMPWGRGKGEGDGSEIRQTHQLSLVVYPIIYKVLYIPGGDRRISEPSTVVWINIKHVLKPLDQHLRSDWITHPSKPPWYQNVHHQVTCFPYLSSPSGVPYGKYLGRVILLCRKKCWESCKIMTKENLSRWWLNQPIWKICSSNWIISPNRDEHKRLFELPPPSY